MIVVSNQNNDDVDLACFAVLVCNSLMLKQQYNFMAWYMCALGITAVCHDIMTTDPNTLHHLSVYEKNHTFHFIQG